MVEILIKNDANVNAEDKEKRTPIHWASYFGMIFIEMNGCQHVQSED